MEVRYDTNFVRQVSFKTNMGSDYTQGNFVDTHLSHKFTFSETE
jgi:hypothetical protein